MTVEIPLTRGYTTIVDDEDAEVTMQSWWAFQPTENLVYAMGKQKRKSIGLHRVVMARQLGRSLERHEHIDHIDGNPLNNCRNNLRIATQAENTLNRKRYSNNTSGYKGVHWDPKRKTWKSVIRVNRQVHFLGYFDDPAEGHEAYKAAAIKYHGEFARFE
jgi:hypothetical protein